LDLKGAFDGVDRSLMIESLLALGLPSAFVKIVASMYNIVKIVVRVGKDFSRVIGSRLGVKQGCTISPRLFSLYINYFEEYSIGRSTSTIMLSNASIMALVFADGIALVVESKEYLQQLLDLASSYFRNKKLALNVKKLVVMVFRKSGEQIDSHCQFTYEGRPLDRVDEFQYLGCRLSSDAKWKKHLKMVESKGNRLLKMLIKSSIKEIRDVGLLKYIFLLELDRLCITGWSFGVW